jgi:hypothetical protein
MALIYMYPKYKELKSRPGGLGDSVEHWLHCIGITSASYIEWKKKYLPWNWGKDINNITCGCETRKYILNILFPYFWRKD